MWSTRHLYIGFDNQPQRLRSPEFGRPEEKAKDSKRRKVESAAVPDGGGQAIGCGKVVVTASEEERASENGAFSLFGVGGGA